MAEWWSIVLADNALARLGMTLGDGVAPIAVRPACVQGKQGIDGTSVHPWCPLSIIDGVVALNVLRLAVLHVNRRQVTDDCLPGSIHSPTTYISLAVSSQQLQIDIQRDRHFAL